MPPETETLTPAPAHDVLDESLAPELDARVLEDPPSGPGRGRTALLAVAAVVLIGLNLRAGIASASSLYHDLKLFLGYGPLVAAALPAIPVACFAIAGGATAWLTARLGLERAIGLALVLLTAGLALRSVPAEGMLLAGTVVSMSGLAVCNVAMPSFIREHYAHRTSGMTAAYTVTMSLGATTASAVAVPVAASLGSPTLGLGVWAALAALALAAFAPLALRSRRRAVADPAHHVSPWSLLRTRRGVLVTALFGVQALLVYTIMGWLPSILVSRGMDPAMGGLMLGLLQLVSMGAVAGVLALAARPGLLRPAFLLTASAALLGAVTLVAFPGWSILVPVVLMGLGFGVFPLVMVVISRSGSTASETTALSTLAQSLGYLLATVGPFGIGLLHDAIGDWTVPLCALVGIAVVQLVLSYRLGAEPGAPQRVLPAPAGARA
jgi:CP family cyanate transporter-like MFS transporter